MSSFFFVIFLVYGYAYYMGSIWIEKGFYNPVNDGPYTSGDILASFFGIIFGMFSLGMAHPNIKAVAEGRVAGKMAFDIIDRKPQIHSDQGGIEVKNITGDIEFKNVQFYYPTRPDT